MNFLDDHFMIGDNDFNHLAYGDMLPNIASELSLHKSHTMIYPPTSSFHP